jgi:hypothetical protein
VLHRGSLGDGHFRRLLRNGVRSLFRKRPRCFAKPRRASRPSARGASRLAPPSLPATAILRSSPGGRALPVDLRCGSARASAGGEKKTKAVATAPKAVMARIMGTD